MGNMIYVSKMIFLLISILLPNKGGNDYLFYSTKTKYVYPGAAWLREKGRKTRLEFSFYTCGLGGPSLSSLNLSSHL